MSGFDVKTLNRMLVNLTFRCAMKRWETRLLNKFVFYLSNTKGTPVLLYQEFKIPHNNLLYAFFPNSSCALCVCLNNYCAQLQSIK